jgi:hypothetical protein
MPVNFALTVWEYHTATSGQTDRLPNAKGLLISG